VVSEVHVKGIIIRLAKSDEAAGPAPGLRLIAEGGDEAPKIWGNLISQGTHAILRLIRGLYNILLKGVKS